MQRRGAILGFRPDSENPAKAKTIGDPGSRTSLVTLNSLMLQASAGVVISSEKLAPLTGKVEADSANGHGKRRR